MLQEKKEKKLAKKENEKEKLNSKKKRLKSERNREKKKERQNKMVMAETRKNKITTESLLEAEPLMSNKKSICTTMKVFPRRVIVESLAEQRVYGGLFEP